MKYYKNRDQWIGALIRRISLNITNLFDQEMHSQGLTVSQVWVLTQLWEDDGLTQKELVEKLGVKPASLTGMIDTMAAKGWVVRKVDPHDARVNRVFLTPEGRELEEAALLSVSKSEEVLSSGFSNEELKTLQIWLRKLLVNIEKK